MSISSLLTSSDEPAISEPKASKMKMLTTKRPSIDQHQHSELLQTENNSTKASLRRPSIQTQPPTRTNEVDLRGSIDTTFSGGAGSSFGKKSNSSFKDFKYHDSMKVTEDADKSDTDVDDDVYQVEKQAYVAKRLKRTAEIATSETEKRKVGSLLHGAWGYLMLTSMTATTGTSTNKVTRTARCSWKGSEGACENRALC